MYQTYDSLFPHGGFFPFDRAGLVRYRAAGLGAWVDTLARADLPPNALAEFAVFLKLHAPPAVELTRPSRFTAHELGGPSSPPQAGATPEGVALAFEEAKAKSRALGSFDVAGRDGGARTGFGVGDVVKVVKDPSSFYGRVATVTDPNWNESGLVKVNVSGVIGPESASVKTCVLCVHVKSHFESITQLSVGV